MPKKTNKTPKEKYFDRLQNAVDTSEDNVGVILIRGIEGDYDDEDEPEFTAEEVNTLRHIIITKNRDKMVDKGLDFSSCGQYGSGFAMFNTSSGNDVILDLPSKIRSAMSRKEVSKKFDALLGLTYGIESYDCWLHDNECYGEGGELEKVIKQLGRAWKKMLAYDNATLGIKDDFTRPGVEALLSKFEEKVDDAQCIESPFDWN